MTFRCSLRFEPDKTKGPGYGLIVAGCPGFAEDPDALRCLIKNPSDGLSLGPNGWQPGDERLRPDAVEVSGETLTLSVGPAVVDNLELQAIYQMALFTDVEHVWQGGLSINRIVYSRDPSLLPNLELAPPKQEAKPAREPMPLPEIDTEPAAPSSLSLDGTPASAVPQSELLDLAERPKSYKSLILNIIFAILTVALLAGAGYFFYTKVLPKTDTTLEEKPVEVLKHEAADLPPGTEAPVKYAPDDLKGPKGLQVARDALKRKVEPETALALAQQLLAAPDDAKAQDGAFLIVDDLAKKGNAQALLLLGDFYSPAQPQRGTIRKDADLARDCYKKALAGGVVDAQQRMDALK